VTDRWRPQRKAAVLALIDSGVLSEADALRDYELSTEELAEWRLAFAEHGVDGLRATRLQMYRSNRRMRFTR
jgi:hypothetical protein